MPKTNTPPIERIMRRLKAGENGCLVFPTNRRVNGKPSYADVSVDGNLVKAHRYVWEHTKGHIPTGLNVLHSCDNPPCCNIAHLFLGTQKDNHDDMVKKGRRANHLGADNWRAKLSDAEVLRIFKDKRSSAVLSAKYGVSQVVICNIRRGASWTHVTGAARHSPTKRGLRQYGGPEQASG